MVTPLTMHLPLSLPSHLSSLLPFLNNNTKKKKKEKKNRNKSQKVFWRKTSACRNGSLQTNQTRWEWHHILESSEPGHQTLAWICCMVLEAFKCVCYAQYVGQRLPVLFQPFICYSRSCMWPIVGLLTKHFMGLLHAMYRSKKVTKLHVLFQPYGHVYDISIPDSFM